MLLRLLRLLLRPSLLAVAAVGIALIVYALTVIVPLVDEVRHALVSQEENTRAVIVGPASLALRINEPEESARIAVEISRAPLIDGIVISNDKNRVIAGAWQGDVMTEKDAVDTILEGNMTRWRIDDGVGRGVGEANLNAIGCRLTRASGATTSIVTPWRCHASTSSLRNVPKLGAVGVG